MKTMLMRVMAVVALLAAVGCSSVVTKQPFAVQADFADKARLEGVWQMGTAFFFVKFDAKGVAQMHVPGWTTNGEFRVSRAEMIPVKRSDGSSYLCARAQKDGEWPKEWTFAEFALTDEGMVMWWPDPDEFATAVTNKVLKGEVKESQYSKAVTLDVSPDDLLKFFDDPKSGKVFTYKNPIILKRHSEKADLLE
jgi:hypothetical protein